MTADAFDTTMVATMLLNMATIKGSYAPYEKEHRRLHGDGGFRESFCHRACGSMPLIQTLSPYDDERRERQSSLIP